MFLVSVDTSGIARGGDIFHGFAPTLEEAQDAVFEQWRVGRVTTVASREFQSFKGLDDWHGSTTLEFPADEISSQTQED